MQRLAYPPSGGVCIVWKLLILRELFCAKTGMVIAFRKGAYRLFVTFLLTQGFVGKATPGRLKGSPKSGCLYLLQGGPEISAPILGSDRIDLLPNPWLKPDESALPPTKR